MFSLYSFEAFCPLNYGSCHDLVPESKAVRCDDDVPAAERRSLAHHLRIDRAGESLRTGLQRGVASASASCRAMAYMALCDTILPAQLINERGRGVTRHDAEAVELHEQGRLRFCRTTPRAWYIRHCRPCQRRRSQSGFRPIGWAVCSPL